jgi:TP901 family phage tail tape measure protein
MAEYDLGRYGAELVLDSSQFDKGMTDAEKKMTGTEKKTKGFASSLGTLATGAIAGLGTALVGAGTAGFTMASNLEGALRDLQSQTGASKDELEEMEQSLKNIYTAGYGESFDDIAQSMATVEQNTGLAGEALENATKDAMLLSQTFDMDINESTRTAQAMMEHFGISADEAFNLMAQGAQNGADKNGDLLDTLNEYSVQFSSLGFSAEQFTNILIDGAENGAWSIDKVGDAIKEFNIRAKDGSDSTSEAFSSLGLNADQMSEAFASGGDTAQQAFQQVMTALNDIEDPMEKNRIGVALFGTMFEDLEAVGISAFANIGDTADLSKDTLGEINDIQFNTFGEAIQSLWRSLQVALIEPFQQHVLPLLSQFATFIRDNMPQIQAIMGTTFSTIGNIIGTVFSFLKPLFDGFVFTLQMIVSLFTNMDSSSNTTFTNIQNIVSNVIETIGSIISDFVSIITELWNKYGQDLLNSAQNAFNSIWSVISKVMGYISEIIQKAVEVILDLWNNHLQGMIQKAGELVLKLTTAAADIWSNFISPIVNFLVDTLAPIFKSTFSTIFDVVGGLIGIVTDVAGNVMDIFGGLIDFITGVFSGDWEKAWQGIVDVFGGIFDTLWDIAKYPLNLIIKGINTLIGGLNKLQIDVPDWVPVMGGKKFGFNIKKIPELATGGVVTDPTLAWVGEGRHDEAVLPLNPKSINPFVDMMYERLKDNIGSKSVTNTSQTVVNNKVPVNMPINIHTTGEIDDSTIKRITKAIDKTINNNLKGKGGFATV